MNTATDKQKEEDERGESKKRGQVVLVRKREQPSSCCQTTENEFQIVWRVDQMVGPLREFVTAFRPYHLGPGQHHYDEMLVRLILLRF